MRTLQEQLEVARAHKIPGVDLEPRFITLTDEGWSGEEAQLAEPGVAVFASVVIPRLWLDRYGKVLFAGGPVFGKGRSIWEGGMQCKVVSDVRVITEDLVEGLFLSADFQNDPKFPFIFGKLGESDLLVELERVFVGAAIFR